MYLGSYSSSVSVNGVTEAAAGDTAVSNVLMTVDAAKFTSCRSAINNVGVGNAYGGSLSIYVGAFTSSLNSLESGGLVIMQSISTVTIGSTIASGVLVSISHSSYLNCSVVVNGEGGDPVTPENSYGGSLSVVIGAYEWSAASGTAASSSSTSSAVCGATNATGLVVSISNSTFAASSASSASILSALVCFFSSSLFNAAQFTFIGGSNVSNIDNSTLSKMLHSTPTDVWSLCRHMVGPSA